ncbi:DUF167 domain-containing protein [Marivita sp. GX14005]|uniref:DUF167 domain-containing protein n=1 Tax=Marivita sp. GX14005 TaxID=2942276 RepID=UPI002019B31A|nr:DUF167 domain-containing protein [Marivita sp. GX14005]MCL3881717.1 DUF167 domain-containing protein [Marivita sp. GX14005]
MIKNSLAELAVSGSSYSVRVTPRARQNSIEQDAELIRVSVTAPASDGAANKAVRDMLAKALGVAKSRLVLVRGPKSRDKVFRLD